MFILINEAHWGILKRKNPKSFRSVLLLKHRFISILMYYTHRSFTILNGGWSVCGAWSTCSATCGSGTWTRSISCDNSTPVHGGSDCQKNKHDTTYCFRPTCPCIYVIFFLPSSAVISFASFVTSDPTHCEVYSIQHHVINYISELW